MFKTFTDAVKKQFDEISKYDQLYRTSANKYDVWEKYLNSFPEGTNNVLNERREYDCNICKNFIRDIGNVVSIDENQNIISIWDVVAGDEPEFQIVADQLSVYVKSFPVDKLFTYGIHGLQAGSPVNHQEVDGKIITWNHFNCVVPDKFNLSPTKISEIEGTIQVFKRGLEEINDEAIDIVIDLISSNSLYRGEEHLTNIKEFKKLKEEYNNNIASNNDKFFFLNWKRRGSRINNDVIGTLLNDISKGESLDTAVAKFESKVAPANYKRPTAVITKGMIKAAMKTIDDLGIESSLHRRFAAINDISVNDILFVNKESSPLLKDSLSDMLMEEIHEKPNLSKIEEMTIENFVENVLPTTTSIEALFENRHTPNLVSMIAPEEDTAQNIFKWNNNFTWSYNGNTTDSLMKERVKTAGGDVSGVLRFSIQWNEKGDDNIDFDAHCKEPDGNLIAYNSPHNYQTFGTLDVDIQSPGKNIAVENITWAQKNKMERGEYKFIVHNYCSYASNNGFTAEIEYEGKVYKFTYNKPLKGHEKITVAIADFSNDIFTIKKSLDSTKVSTKVWNISTEKFNKVNLLTISPNFWDNQSVGNKHYFFIIDKCLTDIEPRGIYNEFLDSKFDKHRKVFEVLGNKTKCEIKDSQLSGIGFSSTKRDSLTVKVQGTFNRMIKIIF